jgi:hypothetical protein
LTRVPHGYSLEIIIIPDSGFQILEVLVNNVPAGTPASYLFYNIRGDSAISATFTPSVSIENRTEYIPEKKKNMAGAVNFIAYPVPQSAADRTLTFSFNVQFPVEYQLLLYDLLGNIVFQSNREEDLGDHSREVVAAKINLQERPFAPGGYIAFLNYFNKIDRKNEYAEIKLIISWFK